MSSLCFVCFGFVGFLAAVLCGSMTQGDQIILAEVSQSISLPNNIKEDNNFISCSWKIVSSADKIIQVELNEFSCNAKCDCDCGRISVKHGPNKTHGIYCQDNLPVIIQSYEESLDISFQSVKNTIKRDWKINPLFKYYIKPKPHRSKRESGNYTDVKTTSSDGSNASMNNSVGNGNVDHASKFGRLPVIMPATFTVLIFVACVACISYKNYNIEEFPFSGSTPDITEKQTDGCCSRKRKKYAKKHSKKDLYDVMLKQYKADTFMTHPTRKSSTINVAGAEGHDPQSIARKHLILRKMRDPGKSSGAVEALIKLSSKALIASSMVQNEKSNGKKPEGELAKLLGDLDEDQTPEDSLPQWQKENLESYSENNVEDLTEPEKRISIEETSYLPCPTENNSKKRNSGSAWFKYKRLEKQSIVDDDSDEELKYDCVQHIQRILSASKENLEEARRILPDDVKDIVLPEDLEAALAEFEFWPDSTV